MTTYSKKRYLKIRDTLPRMNDKCGECDKKLERFGERKQIYFCSDACANAHKMKYRKQWEKEHIEKVREYKSKYYYKHKHEPKKNKVRKFQEIRKSGAFPEA